MPASEAALAMAHEAHHLLGLRDRYNCVEQHAASPAMSLHDRLFWFREQMVRPADPLAKSSRMGNRATCAATDDEDVCNVAGQSSDRDFRRCLMMRFSALPRFGLERRGRLLATSYTPRSAAMLQRPTTAWAAHADEDRAARANSADPQCGRPPVDAFGNAAMVDRDAARFPLHNPHRQRGGDSLRRVARMER